MNSSYYVDTTYGLSQTTGLLGLMAGMGIFIWVIALAISILMIISMWKVFVKAGKPGWASIIPIYNTYIMCEIAEKEWWYILLMFIPIVNIFAMFVIYDGIAKKFGKTTGFTIGMILLPYIFFTILAFGKDSIYINNDKTNDDIPEGSNNLGNLDGIKQDYNVVNNKETSVEPSITSGYAAPIFESQTTSQNNTQQINNINQSINSDSILNTSVAPVQEQSPVMNEPVAPVQEQSPVISEPVAPVQEQAPVMNGPVAPVQEQAPVISEPVTPVQEQSPVMNGPVAPVQEQSPVINEPVAPVQEQSSVMNEPVAPVQEQAPQQPVLQEELKSNDDLSHTSLWSNNNTNNSQM